MSNQISISSKNVYTEVDITVSICCFNDNRRLRRAIVSILKQTKRPSEIIIVDDFSIFPIYEYHKKLISYISKTFKISIKVIRNKKNMGIGYSRKISLTYIETKLVSFLDSDDYWHEKKIEHVLCIFNNNPNVDLVAHKTMIKKSNKYNENENYKSYYWWNILIQSLPQTSGITIKNPGIVKFKEKRYSEDIDFFMRFALASKEKYIISSSIMGYCDREQLTTGGLSGKRIQMRMGQFKSYIELIKLGIECIFFGILFFISLPIRLIK